MKDIMLGVLIFVMGFLIGFLFNDKDPPNFTTEISALQRDIMRLEAQGMENFIKIDYLEHWRDSVVFRPPERKKKLENRKQ